jgi:hypothetical protein
MTAFINYVLAQFVSGWEVFNIVLQWASNNWIAAMFWGGVWASLINYVVWLTPTKIDDSLWTAIKRAVQEGLNNVDRVKLDKK